MTMTNNPITGRRSGNFGFETPGEAAEAGRARAAAGPTKAELVAAALASARQSAKTASDLVEAASARLAAVGATRSLPAAVELHLGLARAAAAAAAEVAVEARALNRRSPDAEAMNEMARRVASLLADAEREVAAADAAAAPPAEVVPEVVPEVVLRVIDEENPTYDAKMEDPPAPPSMTPWLVGGAAVVLAAAVWVYTRPRPNPRRRR
jgi:hypothetical protein